MKLREYSTTTIAVAVSIIFLVLCVSLAETIIRLDTSVDYEVKENCVIEIDRKSLFETERTERFCDDSTRSEPR